MSEDITRNMLSRSFEERVFARFDSLDMGVGSIGVEMISLNVRVEALENQAERRALETKPIWERALAEILEVKDELGEVKVQLGEVKVELGEVKVELGEVKDRLGAVEDRLGGAEERLGAVEGRLGALEDLTKPMLRKVDILTRDVSTVRAEQLGFEDRFEKLEQGNL